ncbi:chain length determinant protein tyrosine kinase EpsG [Rhodocyclus tenuis]|uniref:Chain length determinant protein tyrosine kinase EpsG n=2 Tax=Rhodocyclus TaxID=1064 RepID=A0A6L5JUJ0_RHOTE|nr:chain length determinant protein tyrosine kinase EpsG [Rhodocyclus gracilis]MQY51027.1 chain length determinant protein tyrosine kinase EpsG [Rhodocyclus gracilis]MRD73006.1 chain length determinant protein tyrosine kinase EpsG [Rhodocyclus gracilis]NJA88737.1 chain length determinant protein tyrosine kinase EpsG [Rhodocyclus gracilis]
MQLLEPSVFAKTPGGSTSIGALLIDAGRLSADNAERILRVQKEQGKRFGDAAIELGLLTEDDIRFALSYQFDYPYLPAGDSSLSTELVAAYAPHSPTVEQLRALRSQLMLRWFDVEANNRCLAIVSPGSGEGRSFIAANLAIVFSQLGERTLLIDADLRQPRQHELFKLGNSQGLSGLLAGRNGEEAVVRLPSLRSLSVLPAGAVPPNPQELLGRPQFAEVLASLARDVDVVILDTPAAATCAEAQAIAVRAGAAVLLARKNVSSVTQLTTLTRHLQQAGATLVGSVLNDL